MSISRLIMKSLSLLSDFIEGVKLVLYLNLISPLRHVNRDHHRALGLLGQQLCASFAHFLQNAALLTQYHAHLHLVFYVELKVNAELPIEFRDPACDLDTNLIRKLLEELLKDGLLHGVLGLLDLRLVRLHIWVELPLPSLRSR